MFEGTTTSSAVAPARDTNTRPKSRYDLVKATAAAMAVTLVQVACQAGRTPETSLRRGGKGRLVHSPDDLKMEETKNIPNKSVIADEHLLFRA